LNGTPNIGTSLAMVFPNWNELMAVRRFRTLMAQISSFDVTIDISELKTRTTRLNPSKSITKQHKIQVMLYKRLFDNLVKGRLSNETIAKAITTEQITNHVGAFAVVIVW
jgi:hypothetical protein